MPTTPWSPRRKLLAGAAAGVAVVAVVVLLLLWGNLVAPPPNSNGGSRLPTHGPTGPTGPTVNVTDESWTTTNATVPVTTCPNCSTGTAVNGTLRLTLRVQGDCDVLGCSPNLLSVTISRPFALESSSSSLPTAFQSNNLSISLVVTVPSAPGNYTLHGTVVAAAPPPVYRVTGATWGTSYADASGTYLDLSELGSEFVAPPAAAPGTVFSTNVSADNPTKVVVNVTGITLGNGFAVVSTNLTFPFLLGPGQNQSIELNVSTPSTNGSGSLPVTVDGTVYGIVAINGQISIEVDPFYNAGWSFPPNVTMLTPNVTFVVNVTFDNVTAGWYDIQYTGLGGSPLVTFVNAFPSGNLNVSGAPVTIQITLRYPAVVAAYSVLLEFTENADG
ncbi:MAG: hypothetical protein L3K00_01885 [Thermoplasmata archaeon]|nr:hypothetical protein [Thermoplasmata archaeon]